MLIVDAFLSYISLAIFAFLFIKIVKQVVGTGILANMLVVYMLAVSKWEILVNKNWLLSGS